MNFFTKSSGADRTIFNTFIINCSLKRNNKVNLFEFDQQFLCGYWFESVFFDVGRMVGVTFPFHLINKLHVVMLGFVHIYNFMIQNIHLNRSRFKEQTKAGSQPFILLVYIFD